MDSAPTSTSATEAVYTKSMYARRATNYDDSNGGWHADLGRDFVAWLSPLPPGGAVLDLACGTGLVTIPVAEALGSGGVVVGVDLTREMLDEGRRKHQVLLEKEDGARRLAWIEWIEHDITDPHMAERVPAVEHVMRSRGGFDAISCCSALVLLPSPRAAVDTWTRLLKPGGRVIVDVPTEDRTVQYLVACQVREAIGKPLPYHGHRAWVENSRSVDEVFQQAGLEVVKSWRTRSYVPETWYAADDWGKAFDKWMDVDQDPVWREGQSMDQAREVFRDLWTKNLRATGNGELRFWDGHALYVAIGRRKT